MVDWACKNLQSIDQSFNPDLNLMIFYEKLNSKETAVCNVILALLVNPCCESLSASSQRRLLRDNGGTCLLG